MKKYRLRYFALWMTGWDEHDFEAKDDVEALAKAQEFTNNPYQTSHDHRCTLYREVGTFIPHQ